MTGCVEKTAECVKASCESSFLQMESQCCNTDLCNGSPDMDASASGLENSLQEMFLFIMALISLFLFLESYESVYFL